MKTKIKKLFKNDNYRNNYNYIFTDSLKVNFLHYAYSIKEKWTIFNRRKYYIKSIDTWEFLSDKLWFNKSWYIKIKNHFFKEGSYIEDKIFFLWIIIFYSFYIYQSSLDEFKSESKIFLYFTAILIIFMIIIFIYKYYVLKNEIKDYIFIIKEINDKKVIIYKYK